jgi:Leucine-rich repeat (LRR) protein
VQKKAKKAAPSKIAKKVARSKSGKDNRKLILGATGAGLLGLMIVAAVIFKLRTTDGTLVVEVNQPDAVVQVLDADGKVEISQPGKKGSVTLSVDPGKHRLKVEKNGFKFFAKDFEMESGGTASIKATLEPVFENATLKNPAFQKWMNDVGKLTAERQVEAVAKKLQELNPGFDGTVTPTIEKGVATKLEFVTDSVTDISPVRALAGLKALHVTGSGRGKGKLADLSSLRGMPLSSLELNDTQVSDLSPLSGMNLTMVLFTPKNITKGLGVIRQMKSLTNVGIGWGDKDQFPPDEFWKKYDAGQFGNPSTTAGTPDHKPITNINDPAFQRWMKTVAALPAEQQVEAVVKKLQELNPGFDGKVVGTDDNGTPKIENGVVTEFGVATDNLTDISPVRALVGLKTLRCAGTGGQNGILSDLHPLEGMGLTTLICGRSQMSDLSPLKGLPLTRLWCNSSNIIDLSPLRGMRFTDLRFGNTQVSNLSPLTGMPLETLYCCNTQVSDLSPLDGMKLTEIFFTPKNITRGIEAIRQIKSLTAIGNDWDSKFPPAEFWKKYDAGEFGKPASTVASPDRKPITNINDPAFKQWIKMVAALPAEKQVAAVAKKLQELNPGFDGKEEHKIEGGIVTELQFVTDYVTDISPVTALNGLKKLNCSGTGHANGENFDLSPLNGLPLTSLNLSHTRIESLSQLRGMKLAEMSCHMTHVSDLSPLRGMPLVGLDCGRTGVTDLSPLEGMQLSVLHCDATRVSSLSPLKGMPLTELRFGKTPVFDLSPLKGMPLTELYFDDTQVSDVSPLAGLQLKTCLFTPRNTIKGMDIIRQMKSLTGIGVSREEKPVAPEEFWKKYDAGNFGKPDSTAVAPDRKPITNINGPAFQQWVKAVATMLAEKQVEAVARKLQELNPGFDGKLTGIDVDRMPTIRDGVVTELEFHTDYVTDIAPVRALLGLKKLKCNGSASTRGKLSDLSPLKGMQLTYLDCGWSPPLADLSPLEGMPLTDLYCGGTKILDLSPLKGIRLTRLWCQDTPVSGLSPLRGMSLNALDCSGTRVDDFSPLEGMSLTDVCFTPRRIKTGMDVIRQMKSVRNIGIAWQKRISPDEFWKKYDAGEFGKPANAP